ncbi:MAG: enoyl-CoA hydratase/isomerase family protein [Thermoanaerobaculales bacterium]|nr:enoyl-CoA hydratase/isomerase family protein [Thermoanaerobaculales bacterium]
MSAVSTTVDDRVALLRLETPILARSVLAALVDALAGLAARPDPPPVVVASAHPTIFLAGAHLGEIAELEATTCVAYARLGRSVARALADHPAPVVAAVAGSCSGGGVDLALAADAIVASPAATFSHPGVLRGLVTGWGGTVSLPWTIGDAAARAALLGGAGIDAPTMLELGAVRSIDPDPVAAARLTARSLAALEPSRMRLWRLLRGPAFVDRFRVSVVENS